MDPIQSLIDDRESFLKEWTREETVFRMKRLAYEWKMSWEQKWSIQPNYEPTHEDLVSMRCDIERRVGFKQSDLLKAADIHNIQAQE